MNALFKIVFMGEKKFYPVNAESSQWNTLQFPLLFSRCKSDSRIANVFLLVCLSLMKPLSLSKSCLSSYLLITQMVYQILISDLSGL